MITTYQKGFIAITSVMIISVILLLVATSLGLTGFFTRYNILDSELKKISMYLAEGCVERALVNIAIDPEYTKNTEEVILIDGLPCLISSIADNGSKKVIKTYANYKNFITTLEIKVDPTTLEITCWIETAGSTCP